MSEQKEDQRIVVRRTSVRFNQNMVQNALLDYARAAAQAKGKSIFAIEYSCSSPWNFVVSFEESEQEPTCTKN